MKELYQKFEQFSEEYIKDIAMLMLRLILAYAFFHPAMEKWGDMESTIAWFGNPDWGLGLPLPALNAYMAATIEIVGVALLTLGLATRLISIPLIVTMLVAMFTVHIDNGWLAIGSSSLDADVAERISFAKDILKENGDYAWLTAKGSFVILQNGVEFVVTYISMLLALIAVGPGRLSLDFIIKKKAR